MTERNTDIIANACKGLNELKSELIETIVHIRSLFKDSIVSSSDDDAAKHLGSTLDALEPMPEQICIALKHLEKAAEIHTNV